MILKSAVLVIDVQSGLFNVDDLPDKAIETIATINDLTLRARFGATPVIFIQHETLKGSLVCGSDGWQLHGELQLEESDLRIRKTTPDSFLRTELEAKLRSLRVDHVYVCGYASEFCVDTTARRAAGLGFSVTLVSDAHTTHDKPHLKGSAIREHENRTLPNITSFGVPITAEATSDIRFS